jgi:hypothetical protein
MKISAVALVVAVAALVGCGFGGSETAPSASSGGSEATTSSADGLPGPVAETRSAILAAAESGEYEPLRDVVDSKSFLSDFGFGDEPDPVGRWDQLGPKPLETMGTLLRMPYAVRETNEGTLYEWPQFNADSSAADVSADERKLLLTIMTEDELTNALLPEYGYTGPHLGILADGDWWFFVSGGAP